MESKFIFLDGCSFKRSAYLGHSIPRRLIGGVLKIYTGQIVQGKFDLCTTRVRFWRKTSLLAVVSALQKELSKDLQQGGEK